MVTRLYIIAIILLLCIQASLLREIYVSQNEASHNNEGCGTQRKPCQTISYAITQSANQSDTILLDADYTFIQSKSLIIDKQLTLASYTHLNQTTEQSLVYFDEAILDHPYFFLISNNVTFRNITIISNSFQVHSDAVFMLKEGLYVLVENCVIKLAIERYSTNGVTPLVAYKGYFPNITFQRTNFEGISIIPADNNEQKFTSIKYMNHAQQIRQTFSEQQVFYSSRKQLTISFESCHFINGSLLMPLYMKSRTMILIITNSIFNRSDVTISGFNRVQLHRNQFYQSTLLIIKSSLNKKNCYVNITHTDFTQSSGKLNDRGTYAYMLEMVNYNKEGLYGEINHCLFEKGDFGALGLTDVNSVTIKGSTFLTNCIINNEPLVPTDRAAALTMTRSNAVIIDSIFQNNSAPSNQANAIYAKTGKNPFEVVFNMTNSSISSGRHHNTNDDTSILVEPEFYSILSAGIFFDPLGPYIQYQSLQSQYLRLHCITCNSSSYNVMDHSLLRINNSQEQNFKLHNIMCHRCPYQAFCKDGTIQSHGNFWGLSDYSGKVTFYSCPPLYCCSSLENCESYNTCTRNRAGRLCRDCQEGYVLSLFSHNQCVDQSCCEYSWTVWFGYIFLAAFICLFFLYNKDVWKFFKSISLNRNNDQLVMTDDENTNADSTTLNSPVNETSSTNEVAGIIKITFFFYQTASVIRILASAKTHYHVPGTSFILSFFNIKLDFTSSFFKVCPLCTSNVVLVDALKSSVSLTCLGMLLMVIAICVLVRFIMHKMRSDDDGDGSQQFGQSFLHRLKEAYTNVLLLSYTSVSVFCLRNVHCIEIAGRSYLRVQASIKCYTDWQYLIMVVIGLWVVPFPLVLYTGCRALRSYRISPNEFLLVITLPPVSLYFIAIRSFAFTQYHFVFDQSKIEEKDKILDVLNKPFKLNAKNQETRLIWEPVLILRRLLLIVVTTFISSPIVKLYPVGLLLFIFVVQDFKQKPYSDQKLNFIQIVSVLVLSLLTLFNMFWALTNDIDVYESNLYYNLGAILLITEGVILILPLVALTVYFIYKGILFAVKYCRRTTET